MKREIDPDRLDLTDLIAKSLPDTPPNPPDLELAAAKQAAEDKVHQGAMFSTEAQPLYDSLPFDPGY